MGTTTSRQHFISNLAGNLDNLREQGLFKKNALLLHAKAQKSSVMMVVN